MQAAREMTKDQFKQWLYQFDADKDGKIGKDELREAIRSAKANYGDGASTDESEITALMVRGFKAADSDGDGFISDSEMTAFMEFAKNNLPIKIMA